MQGCDVSLSCASMRLVLPAKSPVCGLWWRSPIPSIFFLFLFCHSSHLPFCVASLQATPTIAIPPSSVVSANTIVISPTSGPLKAHFHFNLRIALALIVSLVLVLVLLILMGCLFKYLRLNFRRKSIKQVSVIVAVGDIEREEADIMVNKDGDGSSKNYSWEEIEKVTVNFSQMIGSGGFSTVYLAHLPGSILGAVKIHSSSNHLNRLFRQELGVLLQLRHDSIVKLLGYCDQEDGGALVFEYIPNGSLQDKLHGTVTETEGKPSGRSSSVLPWRNRMAIAFQLAQALEYLHEKCPLQIVHGDIKASNILLDENLNCKLCDFGFAKMGFSSAVMPSSGTRKQVMMGSPGYTDPHYLRTGIASKKNDLYGYGVIIMELVTGMEAFCEEKGQLLTSIMGPMLKEMSNECEAQRVAEMVDPRLGGDFDVKEVRAMMCLAALCLVQAPTLRPSATQILHTIKENIPSISFLSPARDHLPKHNYTDW